MAENPTPREVLLQLSTAYQTSRVIHAAVQLRLAELVAGGTRSVHDLATATGANEQALGRLLRMLVALGLFTAGEDGGVSVTPLGSALDPNTPGSVRDQVLFLVGDWFWQSWGELLHSVRTGEPAFDHVFGMGNFAYWETDAQIGEIHDRFFTSMAQVTAGPIVAAYDFGQFGTVADIGGSEGPLLAAILQAHPAVRGILFDLPHVVARSGPILAAAGVEDRCQAIGGNFFESVPTGADAYLLKYILHDWDDERAVAILRRCRAAMHPGAKLLVVEQVLPERWEVGPAAVQQVRLDIQMLILSPGGRERTQQQFKLLLEETGFLLERLVPTASAFRILEACAS